MIMAVHLMALCLPFSLTKPEQVERKPPQLLERAVRVTDASDWRSYAWLPNNRLIVIRGKPEHYQFVEVDPAAGKETPLPVMTANNFLLIQAPDHLMVSPDGLGFHFLDHYSRNAGGVWVSEDWAYYASLNGDRLDRWWNPVLVGSSSLSYAWRPGAREIACLWVNKNHSELTIRSMDPPVLGRFFEVSRPPNVSPEASQYPTCLLGFLNRDTALVRGWDGVIHTPDFPLYEVSVDGRKPIVRSRVVKFPNEEYPDPLQLSPQRDRLAWIVYDGSKESAELRISKPDGTEFRSIGAFFYPRSTGSSAPRVGPPVYLPTEFRWTADGKRISFLFKSILYTVAVQ
jgi:hypothetical protein